MMRVCGGRLRGRVLHLSPGLRTRPTSARLREAIFSSLGQRIARKRVADLFAGSGALGIEALSRGAAMALFLELDPQALHVIRANLQHLDLSPPAALVRRRDVWRWLQRYGEGEVREEEQVDVLFFDPPYQRGILARLLPLAARLVESAAIEFCVFEHPAEEERMLALPEGLRLKTRRHGRSAFSIMEGMNS
jgi:16S rRNA (guanine966-N2)-methyltransferase